MNEFRVVGVMSGTSLDGVDIALCSFKRVGEKWTFTIDAAETVAYDDNWKRILSTIHAKNAEEFAFTNVQYGKYLGNLVRDFLNKNQRTADFISSHGHTVFHQPSRQFTFQLGDGAALSVAGGLPVVCDFRSTDVALGGQGAPLVPIGDKLLFSEYDYCLNLGGIANVSFDRNGDRVAFDVCPCNIVLNGLANEVGKNYDENGRLAASGEINDGLLQQLNRLSYYGKKSPKSLGREDVERNFIPLLVSSNLSIEDKLSTLCDHVAIQITSTVNDGHKLLITGGGVYNEFLIKRIKHYSKAAILIPEKKIIEFKEALIFAFLGVLRWIGEINCMKSVTGATKDSIAGAVYLI